MISTAGDGTPTGVTYKFAPPMERPRIENTFLILTKGELVRSLFITGLSDQPPPTARTPRGQWPIVFDHPSWGRRRRIKPSSRPGSSTSGAPAVADYANQPRSGPPELRAHPPRPPTRRPRRPAGKPTSGPARSTRAAAGSAGESPTRYGWRRTVVASARSTLGKDVASCTVRFLGMKSEPHRPNRRSRQHVLLV
jgi:hypothetical protein